jgi:hypothetical protein
MEDLVKEVATKAGITEEQARIAVETMMEFAKAKVPPAFQGMIEKVMKGEKPGGMFGGLFGS